MVKKKPPVVLLTIIGVALAGAVVINAREHQSNLPQAPEAPAAAPNGQPAPTETKASVLGGPSSENGKNLKPVSSAPSSPTAKPSSAAIERQVPKPSGNDADAGWYSKEGYH